MENYETRVVKPSLSFFIGDEEFRLMEKSDEMSLDEKIQKVESYIQENVGKGKSEGEKDMLYATAQSLWKDYRDTLRDVKYTFFLNKEQFDYLTDLLMNKMEYDVNTVFFAIELTNMLGSWKLSEKNNREDLTPYKANATEVTYTYHLISKHKVKGLKKGSYRFSEVLMKIGGLSKIIGYYDEHAKRLSKEITEWVADFEEVQDASEKIKPVVTE